MIEVMCVKVTQMLHGKVDGGFHIKPCGTCRVKLISVDLDREKTTEYPTSNNNGRS